MFCFDGFDFFNRGFDPQKIGSLLDLHPWMQGFIIMITIKMVISWLFHGVFGVYLISYLKLFFVTGYSVFSYTRRFLQIGRLWMDEPVTTWFLKLSHAGKLGNKPSTWKLLWYCATCTWGLGGVGDWEIEDHLPAKWCLPVTSWLINSLNICNIYIIYGCNISTRNPSAMGYMDLLDLTLGCLGGNKPLISKARPVSTPPK